MRDQIEEWYRIVAVVSMPQTAFSHTGAGVKSSVLFLRKLSQEQGEQITNTKKLLQENIKTENQYQQQAENLEKEKKKIIKGHTGFRNITGETDLPAGEVTKTGNKAIENTDAFKDWKNGVSAEYNQKINELKESMEDLFLKKKQQTLSDYQIFMAIAEDIGYDATGRETGNNELEYIGKELKRFIAHIEENE